MSENDDWFKRRYDAPLRQPRHRIPALPRRSAGECWGSLEPPPPAAPEPTTEDLPAQIAALQRQMDEFQKAMRENRDETAPEARPAPPKVKHAAPLTKKQRRRLRNAWPHPRAIWGENTTRH
jgi:hypothetical protein